VAQSTPPAKSVRVSFTPDPAYVSTVRMVAAAVAQKAGVPDELLDEVRLAIGEACSRAVALHLRRGLADPVTVTMSKGTTEPPDKQSRRGSEQDGQKRRSSGRGSAADHGNGASRFTVLVTDCGSPAAAQQEQLDAGGDLVAQVAATQPGDDTGRNGLDEDMLTLGVRLTLLTGLVNDLAVVESPDGTGTEVRMSWPVGPTVAS
jgi:hypothetical protein